MVYVTTADATGKDFVLASGRTVSGKVTRSGGVGLEDVEVSAYDQAGEGVGGTWTGADGTYTIRGLLPGSYKLATANDQGYLDEWYDNIVYQGNWDGTGATLVNVTATNATNKNFLLALGRTISGTVTSSGNVPLEEVYVDAYDLAGDYITSAWTAANGAYVLRGLLPGEYKIATDNWQGYVDEWYGPGRILRAGNEDGIGAMAIPVVLDNASGFDFHLQEGFTISGAVTDFSTSLALEGWEGRVEFFNAAGTSFGEYWIGPGETLYESWPLPPGTYYLRTRNNAGYMDMWWDGLLCRDYGLGDADPVDIISANAIGIDFSLCWGRSRWCKIIRHVVLT